jgi:ADP-glucose pyrophosphorylase
VAQRVVAPPTSRLAMSSTTLPRALLRFWPPSKRPKAQVDSRGTADAVRQNLHYFLERLYEHYLILSGDQLYRMDYGDLLKTHLQSGADVTLGTTPVDREAASGFGILQSDASK